MLNPQQRHQILKTPNEQKRQLKNKATKWLNQLYQQHKPIFDKETHYLNQIQQANKIQTETTQTKTTDYYIQTALNHQPQTPTQLNQTMQQLGWTTKAKNPPHTIQTQLNKLKKQYKVQHNPQTNKWEIHPNNQPHNTLDTTAQQTPDSYITIKIHPKHLSPQTNAKNWYNHDEWQQTIAKVIQHIDPTTHD